MKRILSNFILTGFLFISPSIFAQLSGTYTIGSTGNYKNLNQAVDDLSRLGMSSSVTFNYLNGSEDTSTVVFPISISGLNSSQQLLIQTVPGAMMKARLVNKNITRTTGYKIDCDLKYVTFKNLELSVDSGKYFPSLLRIGKATIENCLLRNLGGPTNTVVLSGATIKSCIIQGNSTCLWSHQSQNIIIENNSCSNFYGTGMAFRSCKNSIIRHNTFTGKPNSQSKAMYFHSCDSVYVLKNVIQQLTEAPRKYAFGIILESSNSCSVQNNMISCEGIALDQISGAFNHIEYNSIYCPNPNIPVPVIKFYYSQLNRDTGNVFRNNSVSSVSSLLLQFSGFNTPNFFTELDYNNWHTFQSVPILQMFSSYNDLRSWSTATGYDKNSVSVSADYYSPADLHTQAIALKGKAKFLSSVMKDIDGDTRASGSSCIGADEYSVYSNNIQIIDMVVSDSCGGNGNVKVRVRNQGSIPVNSFKIEWTGESELSSPIAQPSFTFTGNLAPTKDTLIDLGNYNIPRADTHKITIYTSLPNGVADELTIGDTISKSNVYRVLSGTYTIGGTNPDFLTIKDAVQEMEERNGICDEVVFNIRSGTYTAPIVLSLNSSSTGLSNQKRLIFQSDPSNTTIPIINSTDSSLQLLLNSAKYVTFKKLKFESTSSNSHGNLVELYGTEIILDSCTFIGLPAVNNWYNGELVHTSVHKLQITNCKFKNGKYAIYNQRGYNLIENNSLENILTTGIIMHNDSNTVRNNWIHLDSVETEQAGIHLDACSNFIIENNTILVRSIRKYRAKQFGIRVIGWATETGISFIRNNNIITHDIGVLIMDKQGDIELINNSIKSNFEAILLEPYYSTKTHFKILNNLFVSNEFPVMKIQSVGYEFSLEMDYNNYFCQNNKGDIFVYDNISNKFSYTLPQWKTARNVDHNSINEDPVLFNELELIPDNKAMDNKGKVVSSITKDITGKTRSTSTPDIGAYEFTGSKDYTSVRSLHVNESNHLKIYPNPNNGVFSIDLSNFESEFSLIVMDAAGKVQLTKHYQNKTEFTNLDISEFPRGIFFLRLESSDKQALTKIIVQ